MKRSISALILLTTSFVMHAQLIRTSNSNNYIGFDCYSRNGDVFSFTRNQAALASVKNFSAGVYAERKFLLQELSSYNAVIAIPTTSGNFAFKGNYSGQPVYNESQLSLVYGRSIGKKLDIGAQFNFINIDANEYGHASAINFELALLLHITSQLHTGIHVLNPTGTKLGKSGEEHLPSVYNWGIGYDFSDRFFAATELEKVEGLPLNVNNSIQYKLDEKLVVHAGISAPTSVFFFGLGVLLKEVRIEATANVHPYLGFTPGLLLTYPSK